MSLECDALVNIDGKAPYRMRIVRLAGSSDEAFARNSLEMASELTQILGEAGVNGEVSVAIAEATVE